jgi:arginine/lysine/histidine/glutamine transport system substrate-binding/permease protein
MTKRRKLSWLSQLLLGLMGLFLVLTFQMFPSYSQDAGKILKVATEPTFPPFEMKAKDGDGLEGFDVDLFKAIGEKAGLTIEFVSLPFDGIIPALQAKTVDAAISGMTITAERAQTISFSRPYFKAGLAIATRKDDRNIKNFDDLTNKKIAVQLGTTGAKQAETIPGAKVSQFDSAALALQELVNGNVDAVVNDGPVTLYAIKVANLQQLQVVGELVTEEYYGIALPKNSPNLQVINDTLGSLLQDGTYEQIYQKWFGVQPPELPLVAPELAKETTGTFDIGKLFSNLLLGASVTLILTAISVFFGLLGGTLIAIGLISPYTPLRWLCRAYVEFLRGTPLLVQIFTIYFGLPALLQGLGLGFSFDRFPAAVTALSLNSAAYLAEIIRGGIESIEPGQWEASESLGMSPFQTLIYVIFPQAFRRMLPPLSNEFITLIKDTSLVAVIGFEELFRQGQLLVATTYRAFEIYAAVALVYLVLTSVSATGFRWLEDLMNPLRKTKKARS